MKPRTILPLLTAMLGVGCMLESDSSRSESLVDEPTADDAADESVRWIAISTEALATIRQDPAYDLDLTPVEDFGDVQVLEIDPDQVHELSVLVHENMRRCGGFSAHDDLVSAFSSATEAPDHGYRAGVAYTIDNGAVAQAMIAQAQEQDIRDTILSLSSFPNRRHSTGSGTQASNWIRDFWIDLTSTRNDVSVELVNHSSTGQPSVMMTFTGTTSPDEIVVLGGHLDSIAFGSNSAPGADDDASGIATISEIARVMVDTDFRPERTVKFFGYAAEEVGLRGSGEIAQSFQNDGSNVIAVIQFDMTNYNGSADDIVFIRDYTDDPLTDFVASLVDTYLPSIDHSNDVCNYGCSDHASWHNRGFPTVFPFEARFSDYNPTIHTPNDTLAQSGNDAFHALKFARLGAAYVAEVAKGGFGGAPPPPPPPPPPTPTPCADSNSCGGQAPSGCWCDNLCLTYNDCCDDGPC